MIRALVSSVLWILGGFGLAAGFFWAFLNTPESTVVMLGLSLVLGAAIYVVVAATVSGAVAGWIDGWQRPTLRRALSGAGLCVFPVVFALGAWWLVGRGLDWVAAHTGEISAWFIATLDWSDVRPLLNGIRVGGDWLRMVGVPFAALVWLANALARGWWPLVDRASLVHAASPWRLVLVTAIAAGTLWVPIAYGVYWTPRGLPPTWVEPAFAIAKFGALALVGAIGLSLIIRLAARSTSQG